MQTERIGDFAIFKIKYTTPNSIQVKVGKKIIKPFPVSSNVNLLKKTTICGANIFNSEKQTIEFVISNINCIPHLIVTDSVRVSLRLETTVDNFYKNNGVATFIDKIAAFLGIETSRIKIVDVRKGSAIVEFFIDSDNSNDKRNQEEVEKEMKPIIEKIKEGNENNTINVGYKVF